MLTDEEIEALPEDPEEAFAAFAAKAWQHVEAARDQNNWDAERKYVFSMLSFEEVHGTNFLHGFQDPPADTRAFSDYFTNFHLTVEQVSLKIRLKRNLDSKSGLSNVIRLDRASRSIIHEHISRIKEYLNSIDLPEKKRNSLFSKLNAFSSEVDRNLTKSEYAFSFMLDLAQTAGDMANKLKPVRDLFEPILRQLGKAKEENAALPSPKANKQLPGPPKQLPKPELDDEIPF